MNLSASIINNQIVLDPTTIADTTGTYTVPQQVIQSTFVATPSQTVKQVQESLLASRLITSKDMKIFKQVAAWHFTVNTAGILAASQIPYIIGYGTQDYVVVGGDGTTTITITALHQAVNQLKPVDFPGAVNNPRLVSNTALDLLVGFYANPKPKYLPKVLPSNYAKYLETGTKVYRVGMDKKVFIDTLTGIGDVFSVRTMEADGNASGGPVFIEVQGEVYLLFITRQGTAWNATTGRTLSGYSVHDGSQTFNYLKSVGVALQVADLSKYKAK